MTQRVELGRLLSGGFGLRVSLTGVDARTANSADAGLFAFDSNWTDLAKIHAIGSVHSDDVGPAIVTTAAFPDLGYKPFCEVRVISGNTVFDDRFSNSRIGLGSTINTSSLTTAKSFTAQGGIGAFDFIYVVYKIPVPTQ